jgi:F-type H+-transporting ATPase subunit a
MEKCINVFVGWLHAIGLIATLGSLSLRLFGNIFAGIVLIGVISYLMATATGSVFEIGRLAVIPFWFFEVFVALIQAIVFAFLMIAYFKGAAEKH